MDRCIYSRFFSPVLLLLFSMPLFLHQALAADEFDQADATKRYHVWYQHFSAEFKNFMKTRKQGALSAQQVNDLFKESVVPGSFMTAILMESAALPPDNDGELETLPSVLEDSSPIGYGGSTNNAGNNFVWYMHFQPAGRQSKKPPELPPYGVLEKQVCPYLVFSEIEGQMLITDLPREFAHLVAKVHASRTFIFSF